MSASKSETDIILNKANVALARSQRLVASWLPAPTADDQANSKKTEEELQREEDEIFTAVPETYDTLFLFFVFLFCLRYLLEYPPGGRRGGSRREIQQLMNIANNRFNV